MANHDYTKNVATATRLLQKFGRKFTVFLVDPSAVDDVNKPWRGTASGPTAGEEVNGVISEETWEDMVDGLVQRGTKIAFLQFSATPSDVVNKYQFLQDSLDSNRYSIHSVEPISPGGTIVLWKVKLRQ